MKTPEGTRQIAMFVPADTLEKVDEAAYQMRQRRNDRTTWILKAIDEKLGATPDDARLAEIVNAYEDMSEDGKIWLHVAARVARSSDEFKQQ